MRYEEELARFVVDETGLILGNTLEYAAFNEDSESTCSVLLFRPGFMDTDLPDRMDVMIEAISRSVDDPMVARADNEKIYDALFRRIDKPINVITSGNELKIQTSDCKVSPWYMGEDDNGRHQWASTYYLRLKIVE